MTISAKLFGHSIAKAFNGEIDFTSGSIKVMFCTDSYVPDQDNHQYKSDVSNEVTDTGYTAGGQTLAAKTITYDSATNTTHFDADDLALASPVSARYAVLYQDTGVASTSPLIGYLDFGAMTNVNLINWDAAGVFTHTVA